SGAEVLLRHAVRLQPGERGVAGGQADLVALGHEPRGELLGEDPGLLALAVEHHGDRAHRRSSASATAASTSGAHGAAASAGAPVAAWTRNSTLPSAPVRGDTMAPMMAAPCATSAPQTSWSTRRQVRGSVTIPRPRETSSRPASNWGLTRST